MALGVAEVFHNPSLPALVALPQTEGPEMVPTVLTKGPRSTAVARQATDYMARVIPRYDGVVIHLEARRIPCQR